MKKFHITFALFVALTLAGCSDSEDSENSQNGNTEQKAKEQEQKESSATYTLSFDENYPFEAEYYDFENGKQIRPSEFTDQTNGNTYYYEEANVNARTPITQTLQQTLEESPYSYKNYVYLSDSLSRSVKTFIFDHYNTKSDGSGTNYRAGDTIILTSDTTLYCFYEEEASDSVLDFSKCTSYSLKIGESVSFSKYINDVTEIYIDANYSSYDSAIADYSSK